MWQNVHHTCTVYFFKDAGYGDCYWTLTLGGDGDRGQTSAFAAQSKHFSKDAVRWIGFEPDIRRRNGMHPHERPVCVCQGDSMSSFVLAYGSNYSPPAGVGRCSKVQFDGPSCQTCGKADCKSIGVVADPGQDQAWCNCCNDVGRCGYMWHDEWRDDMS